MLKEMFYDYFNSDFLISVAPELAPISNKRPSKILNFRSAHRALN